MAPGREALRSCSTLRWAAGGGRVPFFTALQVMGMEMRPDGGWDVHTALGTVTANR